MYCGFCFHDCVILQCITNCFSLLTLIEWYHEKQSFCLDSGLDRSISIQSSTQISNFPLFPVIFSVFIKWPVAFELLAVEKSLFPYIMYGEYIKSLGW